MGSFCRSLYSWFGRQDFSGRIGRGSNFGDAECKRMVVAYARHGGW